MGLPSLVFAGRTAAGVETLVHRLLLDEVPRRALRTVDSPAGDAEGLEPLELLLPGRPPAEGIAETRPSGVPWPYWRRRVSNAEVVVYVVPAVQGPRPRDAEALQAIHRQPGTLLLVLNDSDLAGEERIQEAKAHAAELIPGIAGSKWHRVSAATGEGLDGLALSIHRQLQTKEARWFFDWLREPAELRGELAASVTRRAARLAALPGAIPIGAIDLIALVPVHVSLVRDIAEIYGTTVTKDQARDFLGMLGGGYLTRAGARQLTKTVPLLGSLTGAAMAYSTTYAIGRVAELYFRHGMSVDADRLKERFRRALSSGEARFKKREPGKN